MRYFVLSEFSDENTEKHTEREKREIRSIVRLAAYMYIHSKRPGGDWREGRFFYSSVVYETHTREHILRAVVFSNIEETT